MMNINKEFEKYLAEIADHMTENDQSRVFYTDIYRRYCRLQKSFRITPRIFEAIESIRDRVVEGVDGGYLPRGAKVDVDLVDNTLRIDEWQEERGFITARQYVAAKRAGKIIKD